VQNLNFFLLMTHEIRNPNELPVLVFHILMEEKIHRSGSMENFKTLQFSAENLMVWFNDILL